MSADPIRLSRRVALPDRIRRGSALLLAVIGVFTAALLATAAIRMVSSEMLVTENAQVGTEAAYLADQALSQYYENYKPGDNLSQSTAIAVVKDDEEEDDFFVFDDYSSSDLKSADIVTGNTLARVTPTKMLTSEGGDIYLIDATIMTEDPRRNRPVTVRSMRTYATLAPPVAVQAALTAPGGIYGIATKKDDPNRLILKGTRGDKCGVASSVPGLATPAGAYNIYQKDLIKKVEIEPTGSTFVGHDTTTDTYAELLDSLGIRWSVVSSPSAYSTSPNHRTLTPAQFLAFDWKVFDQKKGVWPTILVTGDVNITKDYKGFGMLTVNGSLNVRAEVLKWEGVILVGKKLTVVNTTSAKSHTHIKGAVAAGLNCTTAQAAAGECRVEFGAAGLKAEHLGVEYSGCNVRASMAGMMTLRPMTATRHFKLF